MKLFLSRIFSSVYFRWGVALIISGLSIFLAVRKVSLRDVVDAFTRANFAYVWLALCSVTVNAWGKAKRWQVLMGTAGRKIPFSKVIMSHLAGQALNLVYPARVGDISRAYVIGGMGLGRIFVLGTVALEKMWDMILYASLFVLLIILLPLPVWVSDSVYGVTVITLLLCLFIFIVAYRRAWVVKLMERGIRWLPDRLRSPLQSRFHSGLSSLDILQKRSELYKLGFWSVLIWATAILNNELILLALRISLPLTAPLLILIALQAGISLPSVPGRIGLFQYICVLALAVFGVDQAISLGYGVLLHAVALMPIFVVGLICVWIMGLAGAQHRSLMAENEAPEESP